MAFVPSVAPGAPVTPVLPTQRATEATLWLAEVETLAGWAQRLAPRVLDAGELPRAGSRGRAAGRRGRLVAHVALRVLLGERLGLAPEAVRLGRAACPCCGAPHGRPVVEGGGAHFSLSYSGSLVLLGLGPAPLGVDVERVPSPGLVEDTTPALHPAERAELAALDEESRPAAFARAWARKEAYLKGIGTGLGRSAARDYVGTRPTPAPGPDGWTIRDVAAPAGFAAAVAMAPDSRTGR
ncbi:4'-phosphopantetheinyl transferase superfamily protein [Streptomyces sp. NPDC049837]|uniref:4'-phosphopantetheinyl transferase family protein n=1 Tax=Streptomyces sp. NPDC049837 TaxID=3155277 RepID=UPI00342CFFDF